MLSGAAAHAGQINNKIEEHLKGDDGG